MTVTPVSYRDIPEKERKRLEAELFRRPKILAIFFAYLVLSNACSRYLVDAMLTKDSPHWMHFLAELVLMLGVTAVLAFFVLRPWVKREIEKTVKA